MAARSAWLCCIGRAGGIFHHRARPTLAVACLCRRAHPCPHGQVGHAPDQPQYAAAQSSLDQ